MYVGSGAPSACCFDKPVDGATTAISHMEGSNPMKSVFVRLWKEEEGQDLTEYGLLLVLVALAAIATMQSLASALSNVFSNAASSLSTST